ncbi:hypothetical protein GCM10009827_073920 [Dactylosporangium maewongense]|uniref:Uncharacterized protein n=1 Tax=Dactylosporangium maewongense TaxID=634393 RepID=A0ABP4MFN7_9ACTN
MLHGDRARELADVDAALAVAVRADAPHDVAVAAAELDREPDPGAGPRVVVEEVAVEDLVAGGALTAQHQPGPPVS